MINIACIILNYNDYDTSKTLVNKIEKYESIGQIIIVDNNSTDDSFNRLKLIESKKVSVIKTDKNGGYGYGNNYGVRYAKKMGFEYAIIANPDVDFSENLIIKLCNILINDNRIALATAIQHDAYGRVIDRVAWKIPNKIELIFLPTKIADLFKFYKYPKEYIYKSTNCIVDCIQGSFFLMNIEKFLEVGGYDENMFLYCEEVTIAFKLKEAGYKTILLTDDYYLHLHSVSINKSIPSQIKQWKMIFQNRLYFMKYYLEANPVELFFARIVYKYVILKKTIKYKLIKF